MNVKQMQDQSGTDFQPEVPDKVGYFGTTATSYGWDSAQTAPEDGWVNLGSDVGTSTSSKQNARLYINNYEISGMSIVSSTGYYIVTMPVKKGDTFKGTGGAGTHTLRFLANRTALNGGGV